MDSSVAWLFGTPLGALIFYGGLVAGRRHSRRFERLRREWGEYGARRGLRYTLGNEGLSLQPVHRLDGVVQGDPIKVRTGLGILHSMTTTVVGKALLPLDGRVYVYRNPVFSQVGDVFDVKRVRIDDAAFDGRPFIVESTDVAVAHSLLDESVRRALMRLSESGRQSLNFRCIGDEVIVEWLGDDALPELLDHAFELVVLACASRRRTGAYR